MKSFHEHKGNFYSTETALVRECNYVISDIDRNKTVIVNTGR